MQEKHDPLQTKTYRLEDYGAVPDDSTDTTPAILGALAAVGRDRASGAFHALLTLGAGKYRMSLCLIQGASDVEWTLERDTLVSAYDDPSKWSKLHIDTNFAGLITFSKCTDIIVRCYLPDSIPKRDQWWDVSDRAEADKGCAVLDGKGAAWWSKPDDPRPKLFAIISSKNVTVQDVVFRDSPQYNVFMSDASSVTVERVVVTAPNTSPNTDAVNAYSVQGLSVTNCLLATGDDSVAINAGDSATHDVVVQGCQTWGGHGLSVGSVIFAPIQRVTFRDVIMTSPEYVGRVKSNGQRKNLKGGSVDSITWEDITATSVGQNAFLFTSHYKGDNPYTTFSNIRVQDVTADSRYGITGIFIKPSQLKNPIVLDNVKLQVQLAGNKYSSNQSKNAKWTEKGKCVGCP